jgi:hypothetical protein
MGDGSWRAGQKSIGVSRERALEMARAMSSEGSRASLIEMAQVWLRLAEEQETAAQQQQQFQHKDDDDTA